MTHALTVIILHLVFSLLLVNCVRLLLWTLKGNHLRIRFIHLALVYVDGGLFTRRKVIWENGYAESFVFRSGFSLVSIYLLNFLVQVELFFLITLYLKYEFAPVI